MNATNHAQLAQHAAEARLEELWNADDDDYETLGDYCGCTTCIVREVLEAATPELWHCYTDILQSHGIELPSDVDSLLD